MTPKPQDTEWYKTRPLSVQKRIDEFPPTQLYRMRDTGHLVYLYSYGEDEDGGCSTCTVVVSRKYNPVHFIERRVFGVHFEQLAPTGLDPDMRPIL